VFHQKKIIINDFHGQGQKTVKREKKKVLSGEKEGISYVMN
jgi:hypothetical protein